MSDEWKKNMTPAVSYAAHTVPSAQAPVENRAATKLVGSDAVVVLGGAELREAQETLCRCAQLLQGWHSDGTAWSEWDSDVEKRLHSLQQRLEAQSPQHNVQDEPRA